MLLARAMSSRPVARQINSKNNVMKTPVVLLAVALLAAPLAAAPIVIFNTAVDGSGTVLAGGVDDPHWSVVGVGAAKVISSPPGAWLANNSTSKWIWQNANGTPTNTTLVLETTFDMSGLDVSTAVLAGRWSTDNIGTNIQINGVSIVPPNLGSPIFTTWTSFSVPNTHLLSGLNTLRFTVQDLGVISGFRAEFTTATANALALPVPDGGGTLALLAIALAGLGLVAASQRRMAA